MPSVCICLSVDGVFLNVSTTYARSGSGYVVPSACAKAGVEAFTKYSGIINIQCYLLSLLIGDVTCDIEQQ